MLRARLPSFWWWWWLCATHFLFRGFTTKCTDGLVCLPPSNRAVRVKSEASKSKDTRTTAPPPLLSQAATADAEATAALVGESDFSSILYYYCTAQPYQPPAQQRPGAFKIVPITLWAERVCPCPSHLHFGSNLGDVLPVGASVSLPKCLNYPFRE